MYVCLPACLPASLPPCLLVRLSRPAFPARVPTAAYHAGVPLPDHQLHTRSINSIAYHSPCLSVPSLDSIYSFVLLSISHALPPNIDWFLMYPLSWVQSAPRSSHIHPDVSSHVSNPQSLYQFTLYTCPSTSTAQLPIYLSIHSTCHQSISRYLRVSFL